MENILGLLLLIVSIALVIWYLPKFEDEPFLYFISPVIILLLWGILSFAFDKIINGNEVFTYKRDSNWYADDYDNDGDTDYDDFEYWEDNMTDDEKRLIMNGND